MMKPGVKRVISTANDFDVTGLGIVGYYLKLYAVEQIIAEEDKSKELTEIATNLLDAIESYKGSVLSSEDEGATALKVLLHDENKAKMYVLNLAMQVYNNKLKQISSGPWDINLRRSLWCCIDLFQCVLHLWIKQLSDKEQASINKSIKYCKIYVTKLMKGEIGGTADSGSAKTLDVSDFTDAKHAYSDEQEDVTKDEEKSASEGEEIKEEEEEEEEEEEVREQVKEEKIQDDQDDDTELYEMMNKLKAIKPDDSPSRSLISLPNPPSDREETMETEQIVEIPDFVDSDNEIKPAYSKENLHEIMEKSTKIEQVQKHSRYAISALNYEDIKTAKNELVKALELLNSIK
ncbi:hypothetical protein KAFR_0D00570 [Kazachstania africana CBS 2517]|uniref:Vta1 C-terminal domain-containing protein n=1 Tax=Kazachstania africana (strain ATCC 22294 / BCRC 22015 / CBS 2517 / CECT 1963 / NBRC 1671 / NRRL Y-8276) TaxID=1071382 RepID=H2ATK4_KAZAF|nr:hypothetical protein KAFR_0D00570 [Kazachstania africana CBS 2517]CCF57704.1 hypothetical protein KAFR_0D00570 [Kazachstania africana CBS 2517]